MNKRQKQCNAKHDANMQVTTIKDDRYEDSKEIANSCTMQSSTVRLRRGQVKQTWNKNVYTGNKHNHQAMFSTFSLTLSLNGKLHASIAKKVGSVSLRKP